jgi:hypothetical protein
MTSLAETRRAAATSTPCDLPMRNPERDTGIDELVHDLEEAARHLGDG